MISHLISITDPQYPSRLRERLAVRAPVQVSALGNLDLLVLPKTALFCSTRCPGDVILRTYDQAGRWRDAGQCVISGFHSPMEKECLRILLRGRQPIIICPARGLPRRIAPELQPGLESGRTLFLTPFSEVEQRVTAELAARRNEFVAALAEEHWFAHITPGGQSERLAKIIAAWSAATRP